MRSWIAVAVASTLVALSGAVAAPTAHAASYRYWSYWTVAGDSWGFSAVGAGSRVPEDGDVEGWRFATSGVVGDQAPRTPPAFGDICAGPDPAPDAKRVALVVDPGEAADAPPGESPPGAWATCVEVPLEATGYDVLRTAAQVRTDRGLVCAINDFPVRECAVAVADAPPASDSAPASASVPASESAQGSDAVPAADAAPGSDAAQADVGASDAASPSGPNTSGQPVASTSTPGPDAPTADPSPKTTPTPASPSASRTTPPASPTPTVSVSLITTPPASGSKGGGGSTAGVVVALALAAVGVLGAAALLRSRRGEQ